MQNPVSLLIQKLEAKFSDQEEIRKAEAMFSYKPFVREYKPLKIIAMALRPILGLFSILTGVGYFLYKIETVLPFEMAVMLAVIILVLIEVLKNVLASLSLKKLCENIESVAGLLTLPFLLGLVVLSVLVSVQGAETLYLKLDTTIQQTQVKQLQQTDSLKKHFAILIAEEQKALSTYKESVSWAGKINIHNKTNQQVIERHNDNLVALQKQREKALSMMETKHIEVIENLRMQSRFNQQFWLIAAGIVEGFILLSLWFMIFYRYKVTLQKRILETHGSRIHGGRDMVHGKRELNHGCREESKKEANLHTATVSNHTAAESTAAESTAAVSDEMDHLKQLYGIPIKGYIITCQYCGVESVKHSPSARFCSDDHRWLYHQKHIEDAKSLEIPFGDATHGDRDNQNDDSR